MLFQQLILCEWCDKPLTKKQVKTHLKNLKRAPTKKTFCGKSCSAKWRMKQPEIRKKIYTKDRSLKISKKVKQFYASDHPVAKKQLARIKALRPMTNPETRKKVSNTLKRIKHKPPIQGGNGRGPTVPEKKLMLRLKHMNGWRFNVIVPLGVRIKGGYPTHYKIDIGHPKKKIAIEVDGYSHMAIKRQEQDRRKDLKLRDLGWIVLRFSNQEILSSIATVIKKIELYYTI